MLVTTLHFIRSGEKDEILRIFRRNNDCFKCVFQPSDVKSAFSFHLNRDMLIDYVTGTIEMVVCDDVDPYEQVQVSTMIHPRILFHVSDLEREEVRSRMWDMLRMSWNQTLVKNELSNTRPSTTNAHSQRVPSSQTGRYFSRPNPEESDG
jgi:hypothetical protein